jgi:hypothetical protein
MISGKARRTRAGAPPWWVAPLLSCCVLLGQLTLVIRLGTTGVYGLFAFR